MLIKFLLCLLCFPLPSCVFPFIFFIFFIILLHVLRNLLVPIFSFSLLSSLLQLSSRFLLFLPLLLFVVFIFLLFSLVSLLPPQSPLAIIWPSPPLTFFFKQASISPKLHVSSFSYCELMSTSSKTLCLP